MWKLFASDLKMLARNRQSLFWVLFFPLMFTFIFGLFFGKNTNLGTIAVINKSDSQIATGLVSALNQSNIFKIQSEDNLNTARDEIKKSTISAVVYIPSKFGNLPVDPAKQVEIIYDPGSQLYSSLSGVVGQYLTAVNYQIQNSKPIFSTVLEPVNNRKLTYFDFVLAGVLGLAIMNSSIIGIGVNLAKYREDKILKRITTTPVKSWKFILAEVLSRLVVNFLQIVIILLVGKYLFDAHIYGNVFIIVPVALVGAFLFQSIGFIVASFSKTADAAQGMAQAIAIPMMFLAGVFFPIDSLPKWLYTAVQYLPLAPLLRILRGVMLDGSSPFLVPKNSIILVSWIIVALLISIYKFKLSDE
ncbi:MAG: ABC transporter permease [Candidatus Berkelbacteria bacterium]|nr:ABC transporter permease [Candidatus Berkelbacteria bacterium]